MPRTVVYLSVRTMKKIKAYTLMEVTIAMLLSAICIGICYSAYDIIGRYYTTFQQKNESSDILLSLKRVMGKDINRSTIVLNTGKGFVCQGDSLNVSYLFEEAKILRELEGLRTDTFKVVWKDLSIHFEGLEVLGPDTLDLLSFKLEMDRQNTVPLLFSKHYSAHNLFR